MKAVNKSPEIYPAGHKQDRFNESFKIRRNIRRVCGKH